VENTDHKVRPTFFNLQVTCPSFLGYVAMSGFKIIPIMVDKEEWLVGRG
jgi:hypothetical protein